MSRYFDQGNRLRQDCCAVEARHLENVSVNEHLLANYYAPVCSDQKKSVEQFMTNNPNLRINDFAVDGCIIDKESSFNRSCLVKPRHRNQLITREFLAVPNLSRGMCAPGLEAQLWQGDNTSITDRVCDKYGSRDFARLVTPQLRCYSLPNTISPIPKNSKDIMKAKDAECDARKVRMAQCAVTRPFLGA
jgi:hypothetical protein